MLRPRLPLAVLLCAALPAACGDSGADPADGGQDGDGDDGGPAGDILERVGELPHVVSVEERGTGQAGYRYFYIGFDQPVDHDDPEGQHFTQYLTLIHRDEGAPLVLGSTGYANYYGDIPMEPTLLLDANQLIIEHRYFTPSRPDPTDWSFLRVTQAAADHHEVAAAFHEIYGGAWVSTGGSKGGMTSIYHRYLYPDDVDATVAYVAPYNRAAGDTRYDAWFDEVLPADCLQRVRDAQVDFLTNRRDALVEFATQQAEEEGLSYTRVSLPAAVESAVAGAEWAFFQYAGMVWCDTVPDASFTDEQAWTWLSGFNGPDSLSDRDIAFFEPYYYQSYAELGYPETEDPHLEGLLQFDAEDYAGADPPVLPEYDPSVVDAAAAWVRDGAEDVLFLYGEYDPWTAGAFDLGSNTAVTRYTVAEGTHQSRLTELPFAERNAALADLEAWTGVTPSAVAPFAARERRLAEPLEPPVPIHALAMAARLHGR